MAHAAADPFRTIVPVSLQDAAPSAPAPPTSGAREARWSRSRVAALTMRAPNPEKDIAVSHIPKDEFDNQQDQPDNQDRDADQASQQSQQDELNEALARIPRQDTPPPR